MRESHFIMRGHFFCAKEAKRNFAHQAQQLYRKIAREELSRRVAFYAQKNGSIPNSDSNQWSKGKMGFLLRKEQPEFQLAADDGAGARSQLCCGT